YRLAAGPRPGGQEPGRRGAGAHAHRGEGLVPGGHPVSAMTPARPKASATHEDSLARHAHQLADAIDAARLDHREIDAVRGQRFQGAVLRSEEHTSELQSRENLV